MAKVTDKKAADHIRYVDESLVLLEERIEECKTYLKSNPWTQKDDAKQREEEFKFQSGLFDNYFKWLKLYSEISGLTDKLKEFIEVEPEKELRKGSSRNAFADMVKNGELDD